MGRLQNHPTDAAALAAFNRTLVTDLRARKAEFVAGTPVVKDKTRATVRLTNRFELEQFGTWTAQGVLALTKRDGHWFVDWSPLFVDTDVARRRAIRANTDMAPPRGDPRRRGSAAHDDGDDGDRRAPGKLRAETAAGLGAAAGRRVGNAGRAGSRDCDRASAMVRGRLRAARERLSPLQADDLSHPGHRVPHARREGTSHARPRRPRGRQGRPDQRGRAQTSRLALPSDRRRRSHGNRGRVRAPTGGNAGRKRRGRRSRWQAVATLATFPTKPVAGRVQTTIETGSRGRPSGRSMGCRARRRSSRSGHRPARSWPR